MNAKDTDDPWRARLSEHVDGELEAGERAALEAHLVGCSACRALLADLRALRTAARALPDRAPEADLWPALRSSLVRPSKRAWPVHLVAFAAGVLATLGVLFATLGDGDEVHVARGESYVLLLHETPLDATPDPAEHAAIVERYATWARELGARCTGGEELAEEGLALRPPAGAPAVAPLPDGERVGGYFLLDVRDEDEALALARTCPHLDQGGWIELRRVRVRPD